MTEAEPEKALTDNGKNKSWQNRLELISGLLVATITVIWLMFFIDRALMPLIALAGVERTVPNLRYMDVNEADSLCEALGVEIVHSRYRVDDKQPSGTILDQFPVAGSIVKPGRRIEVIVSEQDLSVNCPNVVGMSPREASLKAASFGLKVDEANIRYCHSSNSPEGVVVAQNPKVDEELVKGTELILTVSLGKIPDRIIAPDLKGRNINDIRLVLTKSRLRLGKVTHFPDSSVPQGTILSQDPPAGTAMEAGDLISIRSAVKPRSSP
ncbi:PASTA domain-containing protein [bacterium]|nr:PASTA domain-containing protein [bacterium]